MEFLCQHYGHRKNVCVKRRDNNKAICVSCLNKKVEHVIMSVEKKLEIEAEKIKKRAGTMAAIKEAEDTARRIRRDDILLEQELKRIEKAFRY